MKGTYHVYARFICPSHDRIVMRALVSGRRSLRFAVSMIGGCMLGAALAASATAQPFEGCPSNEIRAKFEEFGRTGKMPPDMGAWLRDT